MTDTAVKNGKESDGSSTSPPTDIANTGSQSTVAKKTKEGSKKKSKTQLLKATKAQIDAFRKLSKEKIESLNKDGTDPNIETMFQMDDKGKVTNVTQKGCTGTDRCTFGNIDKGTTLLGHTHTKAPSGAISGSPTKLDRVSGNEFSRNSPGPGDIGPLKGGYISGIVTIDGYQFIITGSANNPKVNYLGGGDNANWGNYVEQNWQPNNEGIKVMSRDFKRIDRREKKAARKEAKRLKKMKNREKN